MINKIKTHFGKFKGHLAKINKNCRWEVRYNNLNKKYEEALIEIENLKKKLDTDENMLIISDKNRSIKRYKNIIENLRNEIKKRQKY